MVNLKDEFYKIIQTNEPVFDFIQAFALEGVWYWDLETPHHRWLNTKCYALLDYQPDQIPDWQGLLHPDDRLVATHWNPDQLDQTDFTQEAEIRYIHRDKTIVQVKYRRWLIRNPQGKPIRMIGAQTHQKKKTPAADEQQVLNQSLLGNQSIYVAKTDLSGNYTFVNDYFCQAFELNRIDLLGTSALSTIYIDDHGACQEAVIQCLQEPGQVCKVRLRKPLPDGQLRYTQWEFIAQSSAISQAIELLCIGYDVTDKVRVEDDLSVLMSTTREALLSINRKGILRYVAPSWSRLYGYGVEETMNESFAAFIHPDDLTGWVSALNEVTEWGVSLAVEQRIRHKNGTWLWSAAQVSIDLLKEEIFITSYEITDRKLAEAAHQASEQRFREIADNVDEAFWIHSADPFELLYINSAYERVFGLSPPRVAADTTFFLETILDEDRALVMAEFDHYRQGQEVMVQCRVLSIHKDIRWLQIRTFVMRDSQGLPVRYIGIVNDVTSQKEKEFVLQHSLQREQELNQLKSQFVSTASHEFRTPLMTIQSSVDLIGRYLDFPPDRARPSIQTHLGVIQKEVEKFSALLTDTLTIGRIEAGKVPFMPRWIDVPAFCESLIATHFSERPDERIVHVVIQGTPRRAYIDDNLMSHVLINLLSNAFKFSSRDPELRLAFGDHQLMLQVIDQGIGIPAADVANLFQAFFRASNTVGIQGTGLGLVIARQFVELHAGTLELQSEPHKGTVFTILLPLGSPDPDQALGEKVTYYI
ncbi:sensor histidine kinase [Spirosoma flavum]|uniref:histidine kinase n=1 Tax=Spirosoma flavum TaxID=2048557 RepID=A0ABW6AR81_9BACT